MPRVEIVPWLNDIDEKEPAGCVPIWRYILAGNLFAMVGSADSSLILMRLGNEQRTHITRWCAVYLLMVSSQHRLPLPESGANFV
jgi:hypothetical protein